MFRENLSIIILYATGNFPEVWIRLNALFIKIFIYFIGFELFYKKLSTIYTIILNIGFEFFYKKLSTIYRIILNIGYIQIYTQLYSILVTYNFIHNYIQYWLHIILYTIIENIGYIQLYIQLHEILVIYNFIYNYMNYWLFLYWVNSQAYFTR